MSDMQKVAIIKKSFTDEQIAEGHVLYTNNCGKCHKLFRPDELSIRDWERILPSMSTKARLSTDDAAKVRVWVLSNATH